MFSGVPTCASTLSLRIAMRAQRLVQVMGDERDRLGEARLQLQQWVLPIGADQRVQRGECLVHQQHVDFVIGRNGAPRAVRICMTGARSIAALKRALSIVRGPPGDARTRARFCSRGAVFVLTPLARAVTNFAGACSG